MDFRLLDFWYGYLYIFLRHPKKSGRALTGGRGPGRQPSPLMIDPNGICQAGADQSEKCAQQFKDHII
jgi:hypothetical protein